MTKTCGNCKHWTATREIDPKQWGGGSPYKVGACSERKIDPVYFCREVTPRDGCTLQGDDRRWNEYGQDFGCYQWENRPNWTDLEDGNKPVESFVDVSITYYRDGNHLPVSFIPE